MNNKFILAVLALFISVTAVAQYPSLTPEANATARKVLGAARKA